MALKFSSSSVPLLTTCDVLVVGGSFCGVSAALHMARTGHRVVLMESRTYLGHEVTSFLRPWLKKTIQGCDNALPDVIRACNPQTVPCTTQPSEWTFRPGEVKSGLEDILIESGVQILYSSFPVSQCDSEDGSQAVVVVGNKSGRQAIKASVVIDAEGNGVLADWGSYDPAHRVDGLVNACRWTLEFVGVDHTLDTPPGLPAKGEVQVTGIHPGYLERGHFFLDCQVAVGSHEDALVSTRLKATEAASYIIDNHQAFSRAQLAGMSTEPLKVTRSPRSARPLAKADASFQESDLHIDDGDTSAAIAFGVLSTNDTRLWRVPVDLSELTLEYGLNDNIIVRANLGRALAAHVAARDTSDDRNSTATGTEDSNTPGIEDAIALTDGAKRSYFDSPLIDGGAMNVPNVIEADVLVVGGGSSGAMAAVVAASQGSSTVLLEMNPGLGGTGTFGGVTSYWYGRREGFMEAIRERLEAIQGHLHHQDSTWSIEARIAAWLQLAREAHVDLCLNACAVGALIDSDNTVRGVLAVSRQGVFAVKAKTVIDATGDGDIAAFAGADFVYGSARERTTMWYSLAQFRSPGKTKNNFTSTVRVDHILDYTRAILAGRRRGDCVDHGIYVAPRESRHVIGEVVLSITDQLRYRRWPDVVNIHFSNHDIKGYTTSGWLQASLIPPNLEIEVPYRSMLPKGVRGLLVCGKAISADHDGLPAIRMQSDLENLGGVAGLAASEAAKSGVSPNEVCVTGLQEMLVSRGVLPDKYLGRDDLVYPFSDTDMQALIDELCEQWPLYHYSDMDMTTVYDEPIPMVELASRPEQSLPALKEAYDDKEGRERLPIAQTLALLGSNYGRDAIVDALEDFLHRAELPKIDSTIRHFTYPPDQGAMPEPAYLLYSLGLLPDAQNLEIWGRFCTRLDASPEGIRDRYKGTFYYVDAICLGAERFGDRRVLQVLERLHKFPALRDQVSHDYYQADYFHERQAFLELTIARAMARCGSQKGMRILVGYLSDTRRSLAAYAQSELESISSRNDVKRKAEWERWLATLPEDIPIQAYGDK